MQWLTYIVAGFVALLVLSQFLALRQARRSEGSPAPDTSAVDGPAWGERWRLYYFYAAHCGACQVMTPVVDRLRASHPNLIKVNVAKAMSLARDFGITATPSFVLVEDGTIRRVRLGGQSEKRLLSLLHGT
ncbi:MAG: thioredoxin family protein [Anaerolineae bacterium]